MIWSVIPKTRNQQHFLHSIAISSDYDDFFEQVIKIHFLINIYHIQIPNLAATMARFIYAPKSSEKWIAQRERGALQATFLAGGAPRIHGNHPDQVISLPSAAFSETQKTSKKRSRKRAQQTSSNAPHILSCRGMFLFRDKLLQKSKYQITKKVCTTTTLCGWLRQDRKVSPQLIPAL